MAKEFQRIFRTYGAHDASISKTTAFGRGYDLSPLCGSNRRRFARHSAPNLDSSALKRRGGCGMNKRMRSHRRAADGVVRPAKSSGLYTLAERTTPSARTKVASRCSIDAHPPLLYQEGSFLDRQFIHSFYDRPYRRPRTCECSVPIRRFPRTDTAQSAVSHTRLIRNNFVSGMPYALKSRA